LQTDQFGTHVETRETKVNLPKGDSVLKGFFELGIHKESKVDRFKAGSMHRLRGLVSFF
jgi:hypothetical protein